MLRRGRARARTVAVRAAAAAGLAQTSATAVVGGAFSSLLARAKAQTGSSRDDRWARINGTMHTLGRVSDGHTTKLTPYYDTGEAYRDMWRCVDAAKTSVVWHTYICKDDNVGKITLSKLVAAKRRGVDVELLYDSGGNITGRGRLTAELRATGARVITYRPFHKHLWRYLTHAFDWRKSPALRNHRKILVVDSEVAFIGGLNVGDDYAETTVGGNGRFRDTMCAIRGEAAVRHVLEVCRDTVENQEGAALHPSGSQRWRQWARRVAPLRMGASLTMQRQVRRARQQLGRQIRRAELLRADGAVPKVAATASERARRIARRMAQQLSRIPSAAPELSRRALVAARIHALRDDMRKASSRRELAVTAASTVANRAREMLQRLRRRVNGHGGKQRASQSAGRDDDAVELAVSKRPRFVPTNIEPALLRTPENASECPVLDNQANAAPTLTASSVNGPAVEAEAPVSPDAPNAATVASAAPSEADASPRGYESLDEPVRMSRASVVESAQILMCNPHTRDWSLQRALWIATREAHRRVWVTTPYFLPHGQLFRAVLSAAKRGVDVRIMAGSCNTTDPWFMWYTSQYVRHKLLAAGVKVYEFNEGGKILHAKTVVVDRRWACVGSYNWDVLSNKLLEASVAAYDRQFARTMEEHFLQDMAMSRRVTEDDFAARPWYTRLACCVFYHGVWLSEAATFYGYRDRDLHSPMGRKVDP